MITFMKAINTGISQCLKKFQRYEKSRNTAIKYSWC